MTGARPLDANAVRFPASPRWAIVPTRLSEAALEDAIERLGGRKTDSDAMFLVHAAYLAAAARPDLHGAFDAIAEDVRRAMRNTRRMPLGDELVGILRTAFEFGFLAGQDHAAAPAPGDLAPGDLVEHEALGAGAVVGIDRMDEIAFARVFFGPGRLVTVTAAQLRRDDAQRRPFGAVA